MDNQGSIRGFHHVTAVTSDGRRNLDFYSRILGMKLVKLTVNFDAPDSYHLYYGDAAGTPGTLLTFFVWPDAPRGRKGNAQAVSLAYSIPPDSYGYWKKRLQAHHVTFELLPERFGEKVLSLRDPDGLDIELIPQVEATPGNAWEEGPVPPEYAMGAVHSVTLSVEGLDRTANLLSGTLGMRKSGEEAGRTRFEAGGGSGYCDILCQPGRLNGVVAAGSIHHVARRISDDQHHPLWRLTMASLGYNVTPIMDRKYFRSIYFREPGGVLFEIATDGPGFTVDEERKELGSWLMLPPWLEPMRKEIEASLPPLKTP